MYRLRHLPIGLVLQLTVELNRLGDNTPFFSTFISFYLFPRHLPVNCQHVQLKIKFGGKTEGIFILYCETPLKAVVARDACSNHILQWWQEECWNLIVAQENFNPRLIL